MSPMAPRCSPTRPASGPTVHCPRRRPMLDPSRQRSQRLVAGTRRRELATRSRTLPSSPWSPPHACATPSGRDRPIARAALDGRSSPAVSWCRSSGSCSPTPAIAATRCRSPRPRPLRLRSPKPRHRCPRRRCRSTPPRRARPPRPFPHPSPTLGSCRTASSSCRSPPTSATPNSRACGPRWGWTTVDSASTATASA